MTQTTRTGSKAGRLARCVLPLVLLAACGTPVKNPVTGQTERSVMTEAQEVEQGRKAHAEVLKEYQPLQNARLQAYVNDIGQKLAKQSHRANLQWTFTVLDSPEINAFALPGGYVYITRGIMAYLDSEADMAGILGHEIGHVTARHGAQRATRAQSASLGVFAATVLGAVLESRGIGGAAEMASSASQLAAAGYVAKYSREQELQADGLGAEYLSRVTYDPRNMIDVIRVLKDQERFAADTARAEGRSVPQGNAWLASHPSNDQRLDAITRLAAQYAGNKAFADEGRLRFLQLMDGVRFGESPEQGLTRGNQFYHDGMNFAMTAAPGFRFVNEADQLLAINGAGDAGVIVQLAPANAGRTHDEVIRNLIKPETGRVERTSLNGLQATRFAGTRVAQNGQRGNVELTLVTGASGQIFLLRPAAKDANALQRARSSLTQMEQSFRPMSAADKAAARPWILKTLPYPRGGFAELARNSPLPNAEAHLRLINGVYGGTTEPKPGALVKVVVVQ
jgi:predicted Zn-dependent protease